MPETIDARGLSCPMPVIRTKQALEKMGQGELVVLVDEEAAKENVMRLARHLGCEAEISEEHGEFKLAIRKGGPISGSGSVGGEQ